MWGIVSVNANRQNSTGQCFQSTNTLPNLNLYSFIKKIYVNKTLKIEIREGFEAFS